MAPHRSALLATLLTFSAIAPAQRTWIVDSLGGGDFQMLQPAVDAASPGDIIHIRWGQIGQPTAGSATISKSLTVFAGHSLGNVADDIHVTQLSAQDQVLLIDMWLGRVTFQSCAGFIHASNLHLAPPLTIANCAAVSVVDTSAPALYWPTQSASGAVIDNSTVWIANCTFRGNGETWRILTPSPGLETRDSTLQVVSSSFQGGGPVRPPGGRGGLEATNSKISITGSANISGAGGDLLLYGGWLRYDPATGLGSATWSGTRPTAAPIGRVSVDPITANQPFSVTVNGSGATYAALLVALPSIPGALTSTDLCWLDPQTSVLLGHSALSGPSWTLNLTAPPQVPANLPLAFQGLLVRGNSLETTLPAVTTTR